MRHYIIFVVLMLATACLLLLSGIVLPTLIALGILVSAVICDFYTTHMCLKRKRKEGNPVVAFLFKKIGIGKTFLIMAGVWTCFILFRWLPSEVSAQTAIAIVYWMVPMNNVIVIVRMSKKYKQKET